MPRSPEQQAVFEESLKTIEEIWDPDNWPRMVKYLKEKHGIAERTAYNYLGQYEKSLDPDWERSTKRYEKNDKLQEMAADAMIRFYSDPDSVPDKVVEVSLKLIPKKR